MSDSLRANILQALRAFVAQRPGMDFANYSDAAAYRRELQPITRARHHAESLIAAVEWRESITADKLIAAARHAFSGRLSIAADPAGAVRVDYCTGQYFPTEYRTAVCRVLASALWDYFRENSPGADADAIRRAARRELGATLARHYFDR